MDFTPLLSIITTIQTGLLVLPAMLLLTQWWRIKINRAALWLTILHGMFIINELACRPYMRSLFHVHVLIDSVIFSCAAFFLVKLLLPNAITRKPGKGFRIYVLSLTVIMVVSIVSFFSDTGIDIQYTVFFLLAGIFVANAVFTFTCLNVLFFPYLQVTLFWVLSHASHYTGNPFLYHSLTAIFFGLNTLHIGRSISRSNYLQFKKNSILTGSRDIFLKMLTDIFSSTKYMSSVDATIGRILETIIETLGVEGAAMYSATMEESGEIHLKLSHTSGTFRKSREEMHIGVVQTSDDHPRIKQGLAGMAALINGPVEINRYDQGKKMSKMGFITDKVHNAAAVPMHMQELLLGVIEIQNKRGNISIGLDDIRMLQVLADQTALSIKTIAMYEQLAATDRIQREMEFAQNLQRCCLPKEIPSPRHARFSVYFQPAREIGGDYFDFITKRNGEYNIIIGDVSGKGIPAGMILIMAYAALHIIARNEKDVGEVVKSLSREMYDKVGVGQFMTLNFLEWRDEERTLRYAGAGHEYVIWYHKAREKAERIKTDGIALGLVADQSPHVRKRELNTSPGDVVVLYTDGIIDARNTKSEMYSLNRLLSAVERYAALGESERIQESIINDVKSFMGGTEQYDDMTLVVLSVS